MKSLCVAFALHLLCLTMYSQSKEATISWIKMKFDSMDFREAGIASCYKEDLPQYGETYFCYNTTLIQLFDGNEYTHFIWVATNGDAINSKSDKPEEYIVYIIDYDKLTKVEISKSSPDFRNKTFLGPNHLMTIYCNQCITDKPVEPTKKFSRLTFVVDLESEADLPQRMQKAFNHLISLNRPKETF